MSNPVDAMNEIRKKMGRDPINSMTIEGFEGGGDLPPEEVFYPQDEIQETSPLVDLGKAETIQVQPSQTQTFGPFPTVNATTEPPALMVTDSRGWLRGQAVELDASEQASISQIVLRAIVKRAKEQFKEIAAQITKRPYHRRANAKDVAGNDRGVRRGRGRRKSRDGEGAGDAGGAPVQARKRGHKNPEVHGEGQPGASQE